MDLDSRVQATGGSALSTAKELLQQRHATRNVEAASQVIRQVHEERGGERTTEGGAGVAR